jgi:hypothetical protein
MAIETSATQQSRRPRHNPENNNPIDNGRENLHLLIKSYLSDRLKVVSIQGTLSSSCSVIRGVPQGSIVGPILFLICLNDLPQSIEPDESVLYADDTTISNSDSYLKIVEEKMLISCRHTEDWLLANKLHLNKNKTVKMFFTTKILILSTIVKICLWFPYSIVLI